MEKTGIFLILTWALKYKLLQRRGTKQSYPKNYLEIRWSSGTKKKFLKRKEKEKKEATYPIDTWSLWAVFVNLLYRSQQGFSAVPCNTYGMSAFILTSLNMLFSVTEVSLQALVFPPPDSKSSSRRCWDVRWRGAGRRLNEKGGKGCRKRWAAQRMGQT